MEEKTGFDRYFEERMRDPKFRKAYEKARAEGRGVFIWKAYFGYTAAVDGQAIHLDLSWSQADLLCKYLARLRPPGDSRGYAACKCSGNACRDAWHCLKVE